MTQTARVTRMKTTLLVMQIFYSNNKYKSAHNFTTTQSRELCLDKKVQIHSELISVCKMLHIT